MTTDIWALKKSLKITCSPETRKYGLTEASPSFVKGHTVVIGVIKINQPLIVCLCLFISSSNLARLSWHLLTIWGYSVLFKLF